ncbi:MAG: beta-lactamase family protein [Chryseobacterium sp.]|nr:beta-lactamase family protein [Candidatus Chryseobacterium enterohippi]
MKKNIFLFLSIFLIIIYSCKSEKTIQEQKVNKQAIVDSTITAFQKKLYESQIDSIVKKYNFNGSVALFKDSAEIYRKNSGYSNFKTKTKIDSSTVFAIGSISKQFTAVLILKEIEKGTLKIEDKVSQYLKEFQTKEYETITIKQLLNHTSGMNLMGQKLIFKSGEDFNYSNDGYNALGKVLENVTSQSFDENAQKLFNQLGLKNTFTANLFTGNNFGSAYLGDSKQQQELPNMPKRLSGKDVGTPAGGILSTIDDLHLWNQKLYTGKIIKPETLKAMTSKSATRMHQIFGKMGYGLGIMLNDKKPLAYFHSGYVKGSASLNIYYPETKTSVIILSNLADEGKGKNSIFKPHIDIKNSTDQLENTAIQFKK